MRQYKVLMLLFVVTFNLKCGWKNNPLGLGNNKSNGNDYNTTVGVPPVTPFTVNIQRGQVGGPCSFDQLGLFFGTEICFEIAFNRQPSLFTTSMISFNQPDITGVLNLSPTADPLVYALRIQNYNLDGSSDGVYSISIPASSVTDTFNNFNLSTIYTNNSVELSQYIIRQNQITSSLGGSLSNDSCQGLGLEVWSQSNLSSLNTFFGGSPGISPINPVLTGLVDNLLDADHLQFRPGADNYAMKWIGFIEINNPGNYRFRTASDDGSRVYINGALAVNNDGLHGLQTVTSSDINLSTGIHQIELQFFERGGGNTINFTYSGPDTFNSFISPISEIFQPLSCDIATEIDYSMINTYWGGTPPFTNSLVGIVRDDFTNKHIKVSVDQDQLLKINSGAELNGSEPLDFNLARFIAAHNNGSLTLNNNIGLTSQGFAWTTVDRIWRLECNTGNNNITLQFDSTALDPSITGILFADDSSFTSNVISFPLTELGTIKAISLRCSDLSSSVQYMTLGRYEL